MLHKFKILLVFAIVTFSGCKKWEDHNTITTAGLNKTLLETIKTNTDLSLFAEMLTKTGYDTLLASSKLFTVWAPDNAALASVPAAITGNIDSLKKFVANHIANQAFYTRQTNVSGTRVKMVNGKYNFFYTTKIESSDFVLADIDTKNGVLYTVKSFVRPIDNCWEFINKNPLLSPKVNAYLTSLNFDFFDSTKATLDRIDPVTGNPIYIAGTGIVKKNYYLDTVQNLNNEDKQYTVFLLTDNAFTTEFNKVSPYFATSSVDSTNRYSSGRVTMDLAVEGLYTPANLPDTIVSKYGVKIPLTKANMVSSFKTSNGYVYLFNKMDFRIQEKIPPIIIQGESNNSKGTPVYYRTKFNPVTGQNFQDIILQNHGIANLSVAYTVKNFYSVKYKATWVAYNDFQTGTFQQKVLINNSYYNNVLFSVSNTSPNSSSFYIINTTVVPLTTVALNFGAEAPIGDYEVKNFMPSNTVFLNGANSTTNATNSMALDYIKLVPYYY